MKTPTSVTRGFVLPITMLEAMEIAVKDLKYHNNSEIVRIAVSKELKLNGEK